MQMLILKQPQIQQMRKRNDGVPFCDFQLHIIIMNISASLWAEPVAIFWVNYGKWCPTVAMQTHLSQSVSPQPVTVTVPWPVFTHQMPQFLLLNLPFFLSPDLF